MVVCMACLRFPFAARVFAYTIKQAGLVLLARIAACLAHDSASFRWACVSCGHCNSVLAAWRYRCARVFAEIWLLCLTSIFQ